MDRPSTFLPPFFLFTHSQTIAYTLSTRTLALPLSQVSYTHRCTHIYTQTCMYVHALWLCWCCCWRCFCPNINHPFQFFSDHDRQHSWCEKRFIHMRRKLFKRFGENRMSQSSCTDRTFFLRHWSLLIAMSKSALCGKAWLDRDDLPFWNILAIFSADRLLKHGLKIGQGWIKHLYLLSAESEFIHRCGHMHTHRWEFFVSFFCPSLS